MTDNAAPQSTNAWPLPKFAFQVSWNNNVMLFHEATGLATEPQTIEYRHGDNPDFATVKMPGLKKYGNVTLKKGLLKADDEFWTWCNQIKLNKTGRTPVTISLLDENGSATMTWTLANAWPAKLTGTDLKADGNEVAIDSLEIAHEGITIAQP